MKIIRNSVLGLLGIYILVACAKNPFLLNEEIISMDDDRNPMAPVEEYLFNREKPVDPEVSIFKKQEAQPYRKGSKADNSSPFETDNKINPEIQNTDPYDSDSVPVNSTKPNSTSSGFITPSSTRVGGRTSKPTKQYISPELRHNAKQLMTNGSIPALSKNKNRADPQVVDETGKLLNADEIVQLDYEQIEIRQILEDLADALGMSIVIDPSISGKITMRTSPNQPLRNKDLWSVLNMLLNESGISLEQKAGLYYAKKSPINIPMDMGYPSLIEGSDASIALQITPLKNVSAETALTVLKPLIGPKSKITQIAQLNMLAIVGSAEQLSRINGLIQLIDSDPFKHLGIRLYKIHQAEAKDIAAELESILKLIEGEKASYKVLSLDRVNALLVVAPPRRGFKPVDRWVKILDEGGDETLQEQIFIYHCKSIKCEALASTLNSIFEQKDNTSKKQKTESYSDRGKANVFRTVPKDKLNVKSKNKQSLANQAKKKQATKDKANAKGQKNSADLDVTIVADVDTNTLIVRTTGKDYRNLLETIKLLDQIPLQVLVNVVIAQVSLVKGQSLGLDWAYNSGDTIIRNNLGKASDIVDGKPFGLLVSSVNGNFAYALNALASNGDANILSRPSLLIANNQEGAINVGKEVPVQTSNTTNLDANTGTTAGTQVTQEISYRNTGIELSVIPHINEDGVVTMEITQSLSAIEGSTSSADANFKPTFTNQDISTTVVVGDGETIVLGGLIDSVTSYSDSGTPFLKDLPILGYLFKTQDESLERRELLLIITPKIIGPATDLEIFGKQFTHRFKAVAKYMDQELNNAYKIKNY